LVSVRNLKVHFPATQTLLGRGRSFLKAVEEVSFHLDSGETLGLVGESGCGKTTLGRAVLRLLEPTSGSIWFEGRDITSLSGPSLQAWRRQAQMIFQDPLGSLNPRLTAGQIIGEALDIHRLAGNGAQRRRRVAELLEAVGLRSEHAFRYPHEFSGGQRQRIGIARALAVQPRLIVCDEPVSALDVSVQAQIINLLRDLQRQQGLAYLFIAHDLAVVEHISHRVAVMYLGRLVEMGETKALLQDPRHPYTQALISAAPVLDPCTGRKRILLEGEIPSPVTPPAGCPFHPRCPLVQEQCRTARPVLREISPIRQVACHCVA
jgi:oligopeptide transport system ATP-binding protein